MNKKVEEFLEFDGNYHVIVKDGRKWVAIKPICEVLKVDIIDELEKLKDLKSIECKELQFKDLNGNKQFTICIPESQFHGWLLNTNSEVDGYFDFKFECYQALSNSML